MTRPLNLGEPTICDMNCFFVPGHEGPHQFEPKHPEYDYCNCKDSWEHSEVLKEIRKQKKVEDMSNNVESINPLLDILKDILGSKSATPGTDINEMLEAATQLHGVFETFVKAGFTESQALVLVGGMLKA